MDVSVEIFSIIKILLQIKLHTLNILFLLFRNIKKKPQSHIPLKYLKRLQSEADAFLKLCVVKRIQISKIYIW